MTAGSRRDLGLRHGLHTLRERHEQPSTITSTRTARSAPSLRRPAAAGAIVLMQPRCQRWADCHQFSTATKGVLPARTAAMPVTNLKGIP